VIVILNLKLIVLIGIVRKEYLIEPCVLVVLTQDKWVLVMVITSWWWCTSF